MLFYISFQVSARILWRPQHPCVFLFFEPFTLFLSDGAQLAWSILNIYKLPDSPSRTDLFEQFMIFSISSVTSGAFLQSSWSVCPFVENRDQSEMWSCALLPHCRDYGVLRRSILTIWKWHATIMFYTFSYTLNLIQFNFLHSDNSKNKSSKGT